MHGCVSVSVVMYAAAVFETIGAVSMAYRNDLSGRIKVEKFGFKFVYFLNNLNR